MTIAATRNQRRQLERDNEKYPLVLKDIPRSQWPDPLSKHMRVLRSRNFLVQIFHAPAPAVVRLSVCRTSIAGDRWKDGITWDELQQIKRECGYGDWDAVEVYPADENVVNVANMRHLWIMAEPLEFAWRKS